MSVGATDPKGKRGLLWHSPRRGDVEVSGGNFKSIAHVLHNLPKLPPWVSVRYRQRYRYPRGQTAPVVSDLEGGVPVRDISGS